MSNRWIIPLVSFVLTACAGTSVACLNDTSVRAAEAEFRSRYDPQSAGSAAASTGDVRSRPINAWGLAALAAGCGLVAGSLVGKRTGKRHRS